MSHAASQTAQFGSALRGHSEGCVHIAGCVDDVYAKGLAVTLRSTAESLAPERDLLLHLVDGGMSSAERERLMETCASSAIEVIEYSIDDKLLADLPISHHISHTAYIRLLLGELLPESVERVLYLDSDLLVLDDLGKLFDTELDDHWCAAIPDIACPVLDAPKSLANIRDCGPYMAAYRPVANYAELGMKPDQPYFNSGVMLIDLATWRKHDLAKEFLKCLSEHREHIWCWDQYALNVVLSEHWKVLPLRWNCGGHVYEYLESSKTPLDVQQVQEAISNPAIVHFTTKHKPWHHGNQHPYRESFFDVLDHTAWSGWRPEPTMSRVKAWWSWRCEEWQKQAVIGFRKWQLRGHREVTP